LFCRFSLLTSLAGICFLETGLDSGISDTRRGSVYAFDIRSLCMGRMRFHSFLKTRLATKYSSIPLTISGVDRIAMAKLRSRSGATSGTRHRQTASLRPIQPDEGIYKPEGCSVAQSHREVEAGFDNDSVWIFLPPTPASWEPLILSGRGHDTMCDR
jgi:hypothetical protein